MYFKEEKRELTKLKVKPSVLKLAEEIAGRLDPHDQEPDIDKLFQRLVITLAHDLKLLVDESLPAAPIEQVPEPAILPEYIDTELEKELSVSDMLGGR